MTTISLPSHAYEVDLPALLDCLGTGDLADEIMLDFSPVTFWTPGALVSLLAKVHCWDRQNKVVGFENYDKCPAFRYLQRINFFSIFGVRMSENFRRHDPGSRFVELRRIGGEGAVDIAELSTDIAYCISPDADFEDPEQSGLFDLIEYSVSELASNASACQSVRICYGAIHAAHGFGACRNRRLRNRHLEKFCGERLTTLRAGLDRCRCNCRGVAAKGFLQVASVVAMG